MTTKFAQHLETFVTGVMALRENAGYKGRLEYNPRGQKYLRLMKPENEGGGVYAFIEIATGDIFKPASWKARAKHARGNIYDSDNGLSRMTVHGPEYLR